MVLLALDIVGLSADVTYSVILYGIVDQVDIRNSEAEFMGERQETILELLEVIMVLC